MTKRPEWGSTNWTTLFKTSLSRDCLLLLRLSTSTVVVHSLPSTVCNLDDCALISLCDTLLSNKSRFPRPVFIPRYHMYLGESINPALTVIQLPITPDHLRLIHSAWSKSSITYTIRPCYGQPTSNITIHHSVKCHLSRYVGAKVLR